MKKIIETFALSKNKKIELYFPNIEKKINYFYIPTNKLHKFDEAVVAYRYNNSTMQLEKHVLSDAILGIEGKLRRYKEGLIELPKEVEAGKMVYALNESDKENPDPRYENINFSNFWTWSSKKGPQTFMYTKDGTLYLEIGKIYPWLYEDPEPKNPKYITYEEFIKNYEPILVEPISEETAQQWLKQCNNLIKQIEGL